MMASAQSFEITVTSPQAHGAWPWQGVDPVVVGSHIVTALQTIISRQIDITASPAVVTVGTFHAGVRSNVIPDEARLTGTIRTFDPYVREDVHRRIERISKQVAESMGAHASVSISQGVGVTYNDGELTQRMRPTLQRVFGIANVTDSGLIMGAEDFSAYQERVPGFFFFIGVRPPGIPANEAISNHSPLFYADEAALELGVRAMAHLAVDFLTPSGG